MHVRAFYSTISSACGIAIFSRHLRCSLATHGIAVHEHNLRHARSVDPPDVVLLHYVPSGFVSEMAWAQLGRLLHQISSNSLVCVILHGLEPPIPVSCQRNGHLLTDPSQLKLLTLLERADIIVALSRSVSKSWHAWQQNFNLSGQLLPLHHPGLFGNVRLTLSSSAYCFLGGISRAKKDSGSCRVSTLISACEQAGNPIWQHWTNIRSSPTTGVCLWKCTTGVLSDDDWANAIAGAGTVLCPYDTQTQSVSGLLSEAVYAQRPILATSFAISREFKSYTPRLVHIEYNLDKWPQILREIPAFPPGADLNSPPSWDDFAGTLADELRGLWMRSQERRRSSRCREKCSQRSSPCELISGDPTQETALDHAY